MKVCFSHCQLLLCKFTKFFNLFIDQLTLRFESLRKALGIELKLVHATVQLVYCVLQFSLKCNMLTFQFGYHLCLLLENVKLLTILRFFEEDRFVEGLNCLLQLAYVYLLDLLLLGALFCLEF